MAEALPGIRPIDSRSFTSICGDADVVQVDPTEEDERPRRETQFFRDGTKTIIARNNSPDVGFETSVNPYRGCEHGCIYCFARPTHEYLGLSAGLDFESKIMVKTDAPRLLEAELSSPKWKPQVLVMSGVTDPYQPVERKLRITRGCLEVLAKFRNPVAIITKNRLVTRDIDLLGELALHHAAAVNVSVTSLDPNLQRVLEPRTSSPAARLETVATAARGGDSRGRDGRSDYPGPDRSRGAENRGSVRTGGRAICRLHDRAIALGDCAAVRALARRAFPREETKGAGTHSPYSRRNEIERCPLGRSHQR